MPVETFALIIVLAFLGGAGAATWWFHARASQAKPADLPQPMIEAFARIESRIRDFELQRERMMGGIGQQISTLSKETVALSQSLRAPNARGRWGELTLRRVAELAGMVSYCDFYEQASEGSQRPDMIVRLPGNRTLAVDAKVPLTGYLEAEAADGPQAREAALARHAQQVMRHVTVLSGREYWAQFQPAPEMVVLFLPGDHFLNAALERDPELLERAVARKVLIATPVTFISVLKGVAYGWRQDKLAANAEEIRRTASEFYARLRAFAVSYAEMGKQLKRAQDSYNSSAGTWDARVLPALRRLTELGVDAPGDEPELPHLDAHAREPQEPALVRRTQA